MQPLEGETERLWQECERLQLENVEQRQVIDALELELATLAWELGFLAKLIRPVFWIRSLFKKDLT